MAKNKWNKSKIKILAGEQIYAPTLAPAEEQIFRQVVERMEISAFCMKEDGLWYEGSMVSLQKNEAVARTILGFFFKRYNSKYRRTAIVEGLTKALMLPGMSVEYYASSSRYSLGAALWFLDYIRSHNLESRLWSLLQDVSDEDYDWEFPDAVDMVHSDSDVCGVMSLIQKRKQKYRQLFRKLLGLVDPETIAGLKNVFKDALLDYTDRYMEVFAHITPAPLFPSRDSVQLPVMPSSGSIQLPAMSPSIRDPFNLNLQQDDTPIQAKMQPDSWFLTQTQSLIGKKPEEVRKELFFRRSSDLLMGFQLPDPYAICAAYLFLERDGDALANMNVLTMNMLLCSMRKMPWNVLDVYDNGQAYEEGTPDYTLQYPFHPRDDAEEENIPDSTVEEGNLLTGDQLFYLATGYILPRNQRPSSKLKKWFEDQGAVPELAEGMTWGAWILSCVNELQDVGLPDGFKEEEEEPEEPSIEEPEDEPEDEPAEDYAARMAELERQLKEARRTIHETERVNRQLRSQLEETEAESMQDRAELSQLRETLYEIKSSEGCPEEEPEEKIQFPYQTNRRTVSFGGHESWRKAIRPMLPEVRFFDREALPDVNTIKSADVVWIQANAISHKYYYIVIDTARKEKIPVRYFGFASARKCAEQLVMDELSTN